jgi:small subunit ribosomal protein S9
MSAYNPAKRRLLFQPRRFYATPTEHSEPIRAAPPINFSSDADQFARPRAEIIQDSGNGSNDTNYDDLLRRVRIVPASPSYFTATPQYTDDLLHLFSLYRKYLLLPKVASGEAPRVAFKSLQEYRTQTGEPVRVKSYSILLGVLRRLNSIHYSLMPVEIQRVLQRFKRRLQPYNNPAKPIEVDDMGRARGVGRRKSSNAVVYLVEGDGECLINGRTLPEYFGRLHDRESAVWALKATQRLDKYNVFAVARGGGTTGQAEAITLGVAKALLAHEPDLKPALRKVGVVARDMRRVERKKPGKLKARKMPAWVKR